MSSSNRSFLLPVIKISAFLFRLLPMGLSLWIGRRLGSLGYYLMPKKRAVVYANLRTVFAGQRPVKEIKGLTRRTFVHFAQSCVEVMCLPKIKRLGSDRFVEIQGLEHGHAALGRGKGVILLAVHSGSWELASVVGSMGNYPYNIVANEQSKEPKLDELLNEYRRVAGAKVITPGRTTRDVLRALKNNEVVSLILDQGGKEGVVVDMFGKNASMSIGAIRLALTYGAALLPVWINRRACGRHLLRIFPEMVLKETGDLAKDIWTNTQEASSQFERLLKEYPDEYMWFYKFFKYTTKPRIVILDDGRVGHLRQSQAVSRALIKVLKARGCQPAETIVRIKFKDEWRSKAFSVYARGSQYVPFLRAEGCLRRFLTDGSFEELMAVKADHVISCGSRAAGVNFIISKEHMARSVNVLTPGLMRFDAFDLNIVPMHDGILAKGARVLTRKVALNLISPAYLKTNADALLNRFSHLKGNARLKFALLLGGNTKGVSFDEPKMRMLVNHLKEAALHYNADILVTTSRRTPPAIEQIIIKELRAFMRCPLCVIANQNNVPEAVGGILGLADLVFVSGESVSMVSEAVSSGKKTVVFDPSGVYGPYAGNKYQRFVLGLHDEGYVMAASVKEMPQKIAQLLNQKISLKTLNEEPALLAALEGIN